MPIEAQAIFDDEDAKKFLQGLKKKFGNVAKGLTEVQNVFSPMVFADIIKHFEDEQGSEGSWAPWSDLHRKQMEKRGKGGNKILQDSGRLRQSTIIGKADTGGFTWVNPAQTSDGFPYAFAHNEGGNRLPMRDFMWLSEAALENIGKACLDYILEDY